MKFSSFLSTKGHHIDDTVDLKKGTLAWGIRAKNKAKTVPGFINATIGSATDDDGSLLILPTIKKEINELTSDQLFGYANVRGQKTFVKHWKEDTLSTFPEKLVERTDQLSTLPVTTCGGLTAGLSITGQLFLEENDSLLVPVSRWRNVDNIFFRNLNLREENYRLITKEGKLCFENLVEKIEEKEKTGKKVGIYLNFPNNPSGISPSFDQLKVLLEKLEEVKTSVIIFLDDAYEGYVFEKNVINHSIFPYLVDLNDNVLTAKIDGISKRYCAYGMRLGLVTLGFGKHKGQELKEQSRELLAKAARTIASSSPRGIQEVLAKIFSDEEKKQQLLREKKQVFDIIESRYKLTKEITKKNGHPYFTSVDFNSGFFCYFIVNDNKSASALGEEILEKGLGIVPFENKDTGLNGIRMAFCSIKRENISRALDILYST